MKLRALVLTLGLGALLVAATAASASAHTGPHGPAAVNCYSDGTISVTPNVDKIGVAAQSVAYRIWLYDNLRKVGFWWHDWQVMNFAYNHQLGSLPRHYQRFLQSDYFVGVQYAWNLGYGWDYAFAWTQTYTMGGDFFGSTGSVCVARPIYVTVG